MRIVPNATGRKVASTAAIFPDVVVGGTRVELETYQIHPGELKDLLHDDFSFHERMDGAVVGIGAWRCERD